MAVLRKPRASSRRPSLEYQLIFLASYPLFLFGAVARRMSHAGRPAAVQRSVFAEARQDAHMALPYAF
ncbi:MAG: hypothetical protein EKK41_05420 [Hyphomicrobiales bacterium]|nr:MAG: hypothetical protein EKK41_05420 [Hyphomicrobiales bacterium]